jgi:hypothetical protein
VKHDVVERLLSHQALQSAILVFELAETLRVADFQAAVFLLPGVERLLADPVSPTQLRGRDAGSCSFRMPTICSSVNLLLRIASSSAYFPGGLNLWLDQFSGSRSKDHSLDADSSLGRNKPQLE